MNDEDCRAAKNFEIWKLEFVYLNYSALQSYTKVETKAKALISATLRLSPNDYVGKSISSATTTTIAIEK